MCDYICSTTVMAIHAMPPVISLVGREKEQPARILRSQNQQMLMISQHYHT